MRKIFLVIFIILGTNVFSQTQNLVSKSMGEKFEAFYNSEKYDSIFALFSADMQKALPLDKTIEFFSNLQTQAGKINKRQFVKYNKGYAAYRTNFEKILLEVDLSVDDHARINGLFVKPFTDESLPVMERNSTKLRLPFKEEWTVIWGGDTKELNYHVESRAQKNAFDIIITDDKGRSYKTDGKTNEDYYAFGKELLAPCDGEIVLVVDGVNDNKPGDMNPIYVPGNSVIIRTANNEYLLFAHFRQHSIIVKQGQKIKQGALLGLCGNSGNSSEPHLHFHIQNVEDMNIATGVKCYFDKLVVNGEARSDYSPVKNEKIKQQ